MVFFPHSPQPARTVSVGLSPDSQLVSFQQWRSPYTEVHAYTCATSPFLIKFLYFLFFVFHIMHLHLIHSANIHIHPLSLQPLPQNKLKFEKKKEKEKSISSWKLYCSMYWHGESSSKPFNPYLYLQMFTAESLVWFEASGIRYTIDAGPSLKLLLVNLLLPLSPMLTISGLAHPYLCQQDWLYCVAHQSWCRTGGPNII